MTDLAIRVERLSKRYLIDAAKKRHDTLRDELSERFKGLWTRNGFRRGRTEFWALKDMSFDVQEGEVVGIIGRNGAGKSTLLKILSRITQPTAGHAEIHGRVGSLLEVGTGFHPELSGRDNIYLNGAILGMKKSEIERKFDDIVAFAETEKFIDTPVKRYSSGMYVRLAFAVAAHLEPELLFVDEVLAVGDAAFQKRCLGKMQEISKSEGRTILFVSHNMDAIQRLCSKCLFMEDGQLTAVGDTGSVVARYLSNHDYKGRPNEWIDVSQVSRCGTGEARFLAARYSSLNQAVAFHPYANGPVEFSLSIQSDTARTVGSLAVTFYTLSGTKLVNADTTALGREVTFREGINQIKVRIHKLYLNPGRYVVGLWVANPISAQKTGGEYDHIQNAFEIEVVEDSVGGLGLRPRSDGVVACQFEVLDTTQPSGHVCEDGTTEFACE
jgi:homopolymeric O-antigen transport system ATP-binding protein